MVFRALPFRTAMLLRFDAAWRLGARPVGLLLRHRLRLAAGLARRALPDLRPAEGPFLPGGHSPLPAALRAETLPVLMAVAELPPPETEPRDAARPPACPSACPPSCPTALPSGHGPFASHAHGLSLDLFAPGDVRPVWEANRLGEIPLLALAHRLDPQGGHRERAEARLTAWCHANPPFRGPNWACGQEAALRALHLALAHALLGGEAASPGLRALLAQHRRRIAATPRYAEAQDNNHTVSEPAGLFACDLLLGEDPAPAMARLSAALDRLVAPDGGFAQVSTGYHRLLLDVLSTAEWLRRSYGALPFPPPFAARAAAASRWLARLLDPATGALPRLGHQDGSHVADLSLGGPGDARGSVERAARLFLGASAGVADDPGCLWLGLPSAPVPRPEARWQASGSRGWAVGRARALLRTGPLEFRPGHSDLLNLDLWDGPVNLLRDGGTLSYNPAPEWRAVALGLEDAAGHNAILFDEAEPMPRAGRFLRARWCRGGLLADGAWVRDRHGNRQDRRVLGQGRRWSVLDEVSGPFRRVTLRWRLAPAAWERIPQGVASPLGRIAVSADVPLDIVLAPGWEAPRYGELRPVPVLELRARAPVSRILTVIRLPG
ncbi:MAG: heparinase II/III family protein [Roseomonas mucosa]|nr:heparinase II/III family protein [Roseomonas mucosa]